MIMAFDFERYDSTNSILKYFHFDDTPDPTEEYCDCNTVRAARKVIRAASHGAADYTNRFSKIDGEQDKQKSSKLLLKLMENIKVDRKYS